MIPTRNLIQILAVSSIAVITSAALAASVTPAGYTNAFTTQPPASDWATFNRTGGGGDAYDMDTDINANITAAGFTTQPLLDAADPPAANASATWSSTGLYLQTRPTGNRYTVLMGKFVNNTGTNATQVSLSAVLTIISGGVLEEAGRGMRVYYSLTGLTNSWVNLATLNTTSNSGNFALTTNLAVNWNNEASLYLLWADDNATGNPADSPNQIDNFSLQVTAGAPPSFACAVTAPANNALFVSGTPITAGAAVANGTPPYTVEYFTNSGPGNTFFASAGSSTTPPFNVSLGTPAVGTYNLYAVATDSAATSAVSPTNSFTVTNLPPAVALLSPTNNQVFPAPAGVPLQASANGGSGATVTGVGFFLTTGAWLGTALTPPYAATAFGLATGNYGVFAVATNSLDAMVFSGTNFIALTSAPPVRLTSPAEGAVLAAENYLYAFATATEFDGAVTNVALFANGDAVGTFHSLGANAYQCSWFGAAPGIYELTAVARTEHGATATSAPVHITLLGPSQPFNDHFTNAIALRGRNARAAGNNVAASREPGERSHYGSGGPNHSLWWTWTAPNSGTVEINTTNSTFDIVLAVYTNKLAQISVTNLSLIVSNDDWSGHGYDSRVQFTATAGKVYCIAVDGLNFYSTGAVALNIWGPAASGENTAPFASLTSPPQNARLPVGGSFALVADAWDNDGSVTKVEFYQNGTKVGEDSTFPYSVVWTPLVAGAPQLTAVATDNNGATTTSLAVSVTILENPPPTLSLTSPTNGASYSVPVDVRIEAAAADSDGIRRVDFLLGTNLLGQDFSSPYQFIWTNAFGTNRSLTAVAYDTMGTPATSSPVVVSVLGNYVPTISLTEPIDGDFFIPGEYLYFRGTARDVDGSVTNIQCFTNGLLLASTFSSSFSFFWNNLPAGMHQFTVAATDNTGARATSAVATIVVSTNPPTNDHFTNAMPLRGQVVALRGYNGTATIEPGEKAHDGQHTNYSVWYTWTAPFSGPATISTTNNFYAPVLAVYTGTTVSSLTLVTNGSNGGGPPAVVTVTFNATAGTVYRIAASTMFTGNNYRGNFALGIKGTATNAVNLPPMALLTQPTNEARIAQYVTIPLTADAWDDDGSITKVEFYQNGTKTGEDTTLPYRVLWTPLLTGTNELLAVATDNRGATATSDVVRVVVLGNSPPTVSLTNPISGASHTVPVNLLLEATADDSDRVSHVDFYVSNALLKQVYSPPYRFIWTNAYGASARFTAVAYDTLGSAATSAPVVVTILGNYLPSVALTSPTNNQVFPSVPGTIQFTAVASDVDGSVTNVEFYQGTTLVATDATSPFSYMSAYK